MKQIFIFLFLVSFLNALANGDSSKKITYSAYSEFYYSYDFSNPNNHERPGFLYNHKRHNEFNLNLLMAKAQYNDDDTRANLGLMAGNYAQYNLSAEPTWAQFVYEANAGVRLSKKNNIWLDAGIMPSHIGFESAISADCWTLSRSLCAENSPYYETGIKLSGSNRKENLNMALLVLNGWQRVYKPNAIQRPAIGMQVNYKAKSNILLNYCNFIGSDQPDSVAAIRTFHNLYATYEPKGKLALTAGFDFGTDKYNANDYGFWYTAVAIARFAIDSKFKLALRGEYYNDAKQIIIKTGTTNGFQVLGISSNLDYKINDKAQVRVEGKIFNSQDNIFDGNKKHNVALTTNLVIRL